MNHNSKPIQKVIDLSKGDVKDLAVINLQTFKTLLSMVERSFLSTTFYDWKVDIVNQVDRCKSKDEVLSFFESKLEVEFLLSMADEDFAKFETNNTNIIKYESESKANS